MAHKDWCGKPCGECIEPCYLDESMSCSPDCENLLPEGIRNEQRCCETECDACMETKTNHKTLSVNHDKEKKC